MPRPHCHQKLGADPLAASEMLGTFAQWLLFPPCRVDMHSGVPGTVPSDQYNTTSYATSSQHGYGLGGSPGFAAPLTPFAGVERRAMPPSPAKPARQEQARSSAHRDREREGQRKDSSRQNYCLAKTCELAISPVLPLNCVLVCISVRLQQKWHKKESAQEAWRPAIAAESRISKTPKLQAHPMSYSMRW